MAAEVHSQSRVCVSGGDGVEGVWERQQAVLRNEWVTGTSAGGMAKGEGNYKPRENNG